MEIELKYALANRGEFDRLLAHLQNYAVEKQTVLSQTNTFFDTPSGLLQKAGFILRLRAENDRFVLTAKGDAPADRTGEGVLTCRLEEEAEVPEAVAQHILAGKQDPLAALSARQKGLPQAGANQPKPLTQLLREAQRTEKLQPWGEFTNIRRVLPIKIGAHRFFLNAMKPGSLRTELITKSKSSWKIKRTPASLTSLWKKALPNFTFKKGPRRARPFVFFNRTTGRPNRPVNVWRDAPTAGAAATLF